MSGKDIPFNFEGRLQRFFYHVAVLPSMESGLIPREHLTVSGDGTAVHTHACPRGHHRVGAPENLRHFPDPDASWGWDSDLEKYYFGYTLFQLSCYNSELRTDLPCFCVLPVQSVMIRSISLSLSMNWKNICRLFPPRICAWILQWTITPPTGSLKQGNTGLHRPERQMRSAKTIPDTITIDKDGTPLCQEKLRMKPNGYDRSSELPHVALPLWERSLFQM